MKRHIIICVIALLHFHLLKEKKNFAQGTLLPVPYPNVREADVMWSKKVWRTIDLREKINLPFYYPPEPAQSRISLFDVIKKEILSETILVYSPFPAVFSPDEEFKIQFTFSEAKKMLLKEINISVQDTATGDMSVSTITDTIVSADVTQFWIKEEWFFDKQRSVTDVHILGIAPVVETQGSDGEFKGYKPLFWLYYPACRELFSEYKWYNSFNDAGMRTYDEIFHKRLFSSTITMESNVYNRPIVSYAGGMDILLEAERIKKKIFEFQHDLWHY